MLAPPLTHEDVEGVYAGPAAAADGESATPPALARAPVAAPAPGLVAVAGGKYTTYRVMARDAIDVVARGLDLRCPSHPRLPLRARWLPGAWNQRDRLAADTGVPSPGSSTCWGATAR